MKVLTLYLQDEDWEKLNELADQANQTKNSTIVKLIKGKPLADRTGRQTLAKLSQLGALMTHCARTLREKGEGVGQFIVIGREIREIALKLALGEEDDESSDDNL